MTNKTSLHQFRETVYQSFAKRADALMDLVDALTTAGQVSSPVALSEEPNFRRRFSAVYDALHQGAVQPAALQATLLSEPASGCATIAGYEVFGVDCTPDERPEAETLEDRGWLKSHANTPACAGQKFSWLVRLVQPTTSWVAPWDIRRVPSAGSDSHTARDQVAALAQQAPGVKVIVGDSLYANQVFLAIFLVVRTLIALVRLRQNQTLYEAPPAPKPGQRGAPRKHGAAFKLKQPPRAPDRTESFFLGFQAIRLSAWFRLHFRKLAQLEGHVVRVEFLKPDGSPRYQRPLWLFWTGPPTVALADICRMYLWRFAMEHAFRFMKQHLGLTAHCLTAPAAIQQWVWVCALAYWQLLLMEPDMTATPPAWYPQARVPAQARLTPGQVQRGAARFLARVGTPAAPPRPAGKGRGRAAGYRPTPRPRYPIVRKGRKAKKSAAEPLNTCP